MSVGLRHLELRFQRIGQAGRAEGKVAQVAIRVGVFLDFPALTQIGKMRVEILRVAAARVDDLHQAFDRGKKDVGRLFGALPFGNPRFLNDVLTLAR